MSRYKTSTLLSQSRTRIKYGPVYGKWCANEQKGQQEREQLYLVTNDPISLVLVTAQACHPSLSIIVDIGFDILRDMNTSYVYHISAGASDRQTIRVEKRWSETPSSVRNFFWS